MRKSRFLAILLCAVMLTAMLPVTAQAQERVTAYIEADITTDTTWAAGDYYICKVGNNSPLITNGATLTIEDGCNIYFSTQTTTPIPGTETEPKYPYPSLSVSNGSLVVNGDTVGVTFTTVPDNPGENTWQTAGWNGIEAIGAGEGKPTSLSFTNCTFEYSGFTDAGTLYGTQTNGVDSEVSISATGCTFRYPKAGATAIRYNNGSNTTGSGTISVTNSNFTGYGRGVQVEENGEDNINTTVTGCTFSNMRIRPLEINGGQSATVTGCTFSDFVSGQHDGAMLIFDTYSATSTAQTVTLTGNTFNYGSGAAIYPALIGAGSRINESVTVTNNTFGVGYPTEKQYILLSRGVGYSSNHRNAVWGETGIPYLLTSEIVVTGADADNLSTLTIKPGVTVCLGDGEGSDNLTVRGSLTAEGTADKPITFTKKVGLEFGNEIAAGNNFKGNIVLKYCEMDGLFRAIGITAPGAAGTSILLENCAVRNCQNPMYLAGLNVTLKNCAISGKGIETGGGNYTGSIMIEGCTLTGGTDSGIGVNINNSRRNVLKNCLITGYSSYGVRVENYGSAIENGAPQIENCTISGNGTGVFFYRGSISAYGAFIKNSIIFGNTNLDLASIAYYNTTWSPPSYDRVSFADGSISYSLIGDDGASLAYTNNYHEHPTLGNIAPIRVAAYANPVTGDPLFVGSGDYHLQVGSPCIDAGDPSSTYANEPTPNGNRINLGCYGNTAEATVSTGGTPTPLTFTDSSSYDIPSGTTGAAITSINVSGGVSGGTTPYTFSFDGAYPSWLSISSAGVISGTRPVTAQMATSVTIKATDSATPTAAAATITISVGAVTEAAQPPTPPDPPSPPTYAVPVESGESNVNATATVSDGTAIVSINENQLNSLLNDTDTSGSVSIDAGLNKNIDTATIPASVIDKIADAANDSEKDITGLTVALDSGTVALDAKALAATSDKAADSTISIHVEEIEKTGLTATQRAAMTDEHADDLIVEVTIKSGGVAITNYDGGKITVTLPYTLKAGETAAGVCVWHLANDGTLTLMECRYDEKTQTVSFVTDHLSDFIIGYDASKTNPDTGIDNPFTDVDRDDWFFEDVMNVYYMELMKGTSDTNFDPHGTTTRGMIVTILHRLEGEPSVSGACPFDDVASGKYYEDAITWAAENKIVAGYGNAKFGPEGPITREQMAAILYRYADYKGYDISKAADLAAYTDAASISSYALAPMKWANARGLIQGDGNLLMPTGNAERCQVAAIIYRFYKNIVK